MRTAPLILAVVVASVSFAVAGDVATFPATSQPATQPSLFFRDGALDVSDFLSKRAGFLPIAMPITEPAVESGLALGLTFFHDKPQALPNPDGGLPRVIMPSTTVLFGATTENGTWAAGLAHLGIWNKGKIRYIGAGGYTSLNLDWFGRGDALGGRGISYTNDLAFLYQRIVFQIGDSDFFIGPQYRLFHTDSTFNTQGQPVFDVSERSLKSQTAGLGVTLSYDSLDHPFSPSRGIRAEATYSQQSEVFGGDFDYGRLWGYGITYIPVTDKFVIGLRADSSLNLGDAPYYDLPSLYLRGLPRGRFVDSAALLFETELRYDIAPRWSLIGFGGAGRVADSFGDLRDADTHSAIGAGFRYLIASDYGLRMGVDVGYDPEGEWTAYVTVGTGWIRP